MNLNDIYAEILDVLKTIEGLRVSPTNTNSIHPPAVIPATPRSVQYDTTFGGADAGGRAELVLTIVASEVTTRSAVTLLLELISTDGERSIKRVLESATYTTVDDLTVVSVEEIGAIEFGGIEYLSADLVIQIIT